MCANLLAQASWFSVLFGCATPPLLGYDQHTGTTVREERLQNKEAAYGIACPHGTESCLRRAEAICQGRYKVVNPQNAGPSIQVYLDGRIQTLNAVNPYFIHVSCETTALNGAGR